MTKHGFLEVPYRKDYLKLVRTFKEKLLLESSPNLTISCHAPFMCVFFLAFCHGRAAGLKNNFIQRADNICQRMKKEVRDI
jgi:hypothetical protein